MAAIAVAIALGMEYIEGMQAAARYLGGRPDEMLLLARVLADAADVLRRVQVRAEWGAGATGGPPEPARLAARARVWAETSSDEVRRRARQLTDEPRAHFEEPQFPPFAGGQHGKRRLQLSHSEAQLERARAVVDDPSASKAAKKAAQEVLRTNGKDVSTRRNRQTKDAKPAPQGARARREAGREREARKAAREAAESARRAAEDAARAKMAKDGSGLGGATAAVGAAIGTAAIGVWWAGKALSPACGPAVVVCAVVL